MVSSLPAAAFVQMVSSTQPQILAALLGQTLSSTNAFCQLVQTQLPPPRQSTFEKYGTYLYHRACTPGSPGSPGLYPFQIETVQRIVNHLSTSGSKTAVAVLPTGTGKSGIIAILPYAVRSHRTLVITPRSNIRDQNSREFFEPRAAAGAAHPVPMPVLMKTGIIDQQALAASSTGATMKDLFPFYLVPSSSDVLLEESQKHDVIVANAQLFNKSDEAKWRKLLNPGLFDLIIVDEAHHYPAPTWDEILKHFGAASKVFLTATIKRNDGLSVCNDSDICLKMYRQTAVQKGIIRDVQPHELATPDATSQQLLLQEPAPQPGGATQKQVHREMLAEVLRILDIKDSDPSTALPGDWKHKAMVIASNNQVASTIADLAHAEFPTLDAEAYHTAIQPAIQQTVLDNFMHNRTSHRVVVVCGQLQEGFNHPPVSVVAILKPLGGAAGSQFTQAVGRAVRKVPGEPAALKADVIWHRHLQFGYDQSSNFALYSRDELALPGGTDYPVYI